MQLVVPQGELVYGRVGVTVRLEQGIQGVFTLQNSLFSSFLTPPPAGACCLANSCALIPASVCAAHGGIFQGVGTTCGATCSPGDTDGDHDVDVDDLLPIITWWGSCGSSCQSAYMPCAADLNADCMVNVDDLLLVILNWSP
jgi:hypothetical protein